MDLTHLSEQQVYTLCGIAGYLTLATLVISTAVIAGILRRNGAAESPAALTAERSRNPAQAPCDGTPVAA